MEETGNPPTYQTNWIGQLFFWYLNGSMALANQRCEEKKSLTRISLYFMWIEKDIIKMSPEDKPDLIRAKFKKAFDETGSIVRAMLRVWGCTFWISLIQLLMANILQVKKKDL